MMILIFCFQILNMLTYLGSNQIQSCDTLQNEDLG